MDALPLLSGAPTYMEFSSEGEVHTYKFTMTRNEAGLALNRAHRREFLLSGLLACGCCGGCM